MNVKKNKKIPRQSHCRGIDTQFLRPVANNTNAIINRTINTKKIILAISAEAAATPVKPNTPATIEINKNISTQRNIKAPYLSINNVIFTSAFCSAAMVHATMTTKRTC